MRALAITLLYFLTRLAFSATSITPPSPLQYVSVSGETRLYYLTTTIPATSYNPAYPLIDISTSASPSSTLTFYVSGTSSSNLYFYFTAKDDDGEQRLISVSSSTTSGTQPTGGTPSVTGIYNGSAASSFYVTLNPKAICEFSNSNTLDLNGCTTGTPNTSGIEISLHEASSATFDTSAEALTTFTLMPQSSAPTPSTGCTTRASESFFQPGDGAVIILNEGYSMTSSNGDPASFLYLAYSQNPSLDSTTHQSSTTRVTLGINAGSSEITNFENAPNASLNQYYMVAGVQDAAGAIAFCNSGNAYNVFSVDIQTFLKEGKCFIATASFGSSKASEVMILRQFRDKVLSQFSLGRFLIESYYQFSPRAADWLIENSALRPLALRLLVPFEIFAWIFVSGAWVLAFVLYGLLLAYFIFKKASAFSHVSLTVFFLFTFSGTAQESQQPYIDSLLSKLPHSESETPQEDGSYIESIKKKLKTPTDDESYIDNVKQNLKPQPQTESYSEDVKSKLKSKPEITTEEILNHKLKADKNLSVRPNRAFGFNIGANQVRDLSAGDIEEVTFDEVYPSFWIPDLKLFYEMRPFQLSNFIDLGLHASIEAMWVKGTGKLPSWVPSNFSSQTKLTFFILPINLGPILRLNIADFIYPYIGVGPNVTGFYELRSDSRPSNKSYSFGFWLSAGLNFGIDWISSKESWSQYDERNIKHNYITLDYTQLTVSGGDVHASIRTLAIGFMHEL